MSNILPVLDALEVGSYWIIGLFALLEGWWVTGIVVPGTLVVDAGGMLVQLGHLGFGTLVFFVAFGAILGGEASWHSSRWLGGHVNLPRGRILKGTQTLLRQHNVVALIIGRLLGPMTGLAIMAAAVSGMSRRRFVLWNVVSGLVYAIVHVSIGFFVGDLLITVIPYLPRLALPVLALILLVIITWLVTRQIRQSGPVAVETFDQIRQRLANWPLTLQLIQRYPRVSGFLARRLNPRHGGGLMATAILCLTVYLIGVFVDNALDLTFLPQTAALDDRVSNLAHAYWSPAGLWLAGWLTQLGHVPVATIVAFGAAAALALWGRRAAAVGLIVAVVGDAIVVTLLKLAFGRARPQLGYFLESSHSFPSGHAAISVALYGCLFLILWRERLIGPTLALIAGVGTAATIGLTRIYLIEHYLSDVLNGWIIGAIWMVIGYAVAEALRGRPMNNQAPYRIATGLAVVATLAGGGWFAVNHRPVQREVTDDAATIYPDMAAALEAGQVPLKVVSLTGEELPPVTMIAVGQSPQEVADILIDKGWTPVPRPDLGSIIAAVRNKITDDSPIIATAPLAFRSALPAEVTLRDPTSRTLLRLWGAGQTDTGRKNAAGSIASAGKSD
ncbi:phosphatase PAP2 family protein [Paracoccus sp. R86501]|uniref:phosphatase PAP2 family protein n=1 Tax=Paracoccus sp. R86501 TaxID=3101711 RepID=UPI0036724279